MLPDYAELYSLSSFSFQRGASQPEELVERAHALGYRALAITDECSVAGVVRAHTQAKELGLKIEGPQEADRFWIAQLDDDGPRWGMHAETFEPDRWLEQGDTVTVGELTLDVIHCPGHTPGHVVFYHAPSRFAIVGDVLFQGSIGRTDFPMSNHQDLIDAITQRLWPLGEDVTFVPGHGPTSTFGRERQTNQFVSDYALS